MSPQATNIAKRWNMPFRTNGWNGHAKRGDLAKSPHGQKVDGRQVSDGASSGRTKRLLRRAAAIALLALVATQASARVIVQGTRFVYPAKESEISVGLINKSDHPVLMKAWIDSGDAQVAPERLKVPFLVTPPLVRIEEGKQHLYRLQFTGSAGELPADRESVYWINLLEVPPKPTPRQGVDEAKSKASIQLAFQYRVKLFYRPDGLNGDPTEAAKKLTWSVKKADGTKVSLVVKNDSPYHVSLTKITLDDGDKDINVAPDMLKPFSSATFDVADGKAKSKAKVTYQWLDDWGGIHSHTVSVD